MHRLILNDRQNRGFCPEFRYIDRFDYIWKNGFEWSEFNSNLWIKKCVWNQFLFVKMAMNRNFNQNGCLFTNDIAVTMLCPDLNKNNIECVNSMVNVHFWIYFRTKKKLQIAQKLWKNGLSQRIRFYQRRWESVDFIFCDHRNEVMAIFGNL